MPSQDYKKKRDAEAEFALGNKPHDRAEHTGPSQPKRKPGSCRALKNHENFRGSQPISLTQPAGGKGKKTPRRIVPCLTLHPVRIGTVPLPATTLPP